MVFSLLYLGLCRIFDLVVTRRTGRDKDIEILVLRHQEKILERQLHERLRYRPGQFVKNPPDPSRSPDRHESPDQMACMYMRNRVANEGARKCLRGHRHDRSGVTTR